MEDRIEKIIAANPQYVEIKYNEKTIRMNVLYRLSVVDYLTVRIVDYEEFYEMPILKKIECDYHKQKTILDIGANIGNHTVFFENFLEFDKIVCFEPNPEVFNVLLSNIHSPKTTAYPVAVGDVAGRASLENPEWWNSGGGHLSPGDDFPVVVLDDFCEENNIQDVTFMKIDVEGNELNVLKGAQRLLERDHPVIFTEVSRDKELISEFLAKFGYWLGFTHYYDGMMTCEFI